MSDLKVKLCGMMRPEDARAAAEAGADFVGMVLHASSKRTIDLDRARQIVQAVPDSVTPVGLFVNATADFIRSTAHVLGLRYVQLHGNETPEFVRSLEGPSVFKVIRVQAASLASDLDRWRGFDGVSALLLDTGSTALPGGTGVENDWAVIREHQSTGGFVGLPPIMLAGGLRPENVADVVKMLRPWGVDVSSGIEASVGVKSREKMIEFVRSARKAAG